MDNDDKWRMVEDEFLTVARQFTAHIHAAEYQRLKKAADEQNAEAISNMSRPVTGPMSTLARQRRDRAALRSYQRKALKRARFDDRGDVLSPWRGTSLNSLMERPRREVSKLMPTMSTNSTTRTFAGFKSGPKDTEAVETTIAKTNPVKREVLSENESDDNDSDDLDSSTFHLTRKHVTYPSPRNLSGITEGMRPSRSEWCALNRTKEPRTRAELPGPTIKNGCGTDSSNSVKPAPTVPHSCAKAVDSSSTIRYDDYGGYDDDDDGFGIISGLKERLSHRRLRRLRAQRVQASSSDVRAVDV